MDVPDSWGLHDKVVIVTGGMSAAARERRRTASALKIEGTGHAVRYLLSNFARYITGHVLVVDGRATLSGPERDAGGAGG